MAAANRMTALAVVNEVQRKLGLNATSDFSSKHARMLMQLLNEVLSEVADFGNWPDYYEEVTVSAQAGTRQYSVRVSGRDVHNILEVAWASAAGELQHRSIQEMRRLRRGANATGRPTQYCLIDVDASGNPRIEVHPTVSTTHANGRFSVAVYASERLLTTSDTTKELKYPANLLIAGVYAKALLDESGGSQTQQFQTAYAEYQRLMKEAQARYTTDTEDVIRIVPGGRR